MSLEFLVLFFQEKSTEENRYHYIYGENGVVALHTSTVTYTPVPPIDDPWFEEAFEQGTSEGNRPAGTITTEEMYYVHTDHLGSYCAITNKDQNIVQSNRFDAWGNSLSLTGLTGFTLINRGFTGHEHYPQFKIINMNARLYDPVIGRFFSPDAIKFL